MVNFKSKQNEFEGNLTIKLCGKTLYPSESAEYLIVEIDTNLIGWYNDNELSINMNRANAFFFLNWKIYCFKNIEIHIFCFFGS